MAERRQPLRMQVVEVDEAVPEQDGPDAAARPDAGDPAGRGPPVRARWSPPRGWVVALAAVLVLALVGAWQLGAAHDRAYVRHLASVPGLVRPLDGAPRQAWTARDALGLSTTMEVAAGRLVLVQQVGDQLVVAAHDAVTGQTVWSVPAARTLGGDTEGPDVRCPSQGLDVGSLVVCLVTPARSVYVTPQGRANPPATTVLALAAADGRQVGRWQVTDAVVDAARLGADVALLTYDSRGYMGVTLRDAVSGAVLWDHRSRDGLESARATPATSMRLEAGRLVVQGAGTLVLDASSGAVALDEPSLQNVVVVPVGDGLATWRIGARWQVSGPDGRSRYRLPGMPALLRYDDGSVHHLLLTDSGDALHGVDEESGTVRWTSPIEMNVVGIVSGRLVVAGDDRFGVADPGDGTMLWDRETGQTLPWSPLSDGALVLAPGLSDTGQSQLVAYHLDDGVAAWEIDLPGQVVDVQTVGGMIVVRTTGGVVVYR